MTDPAHDSPPAGFAGLPNDLTEEELNAAPILTSLDELLIEELTDEEADAFFAALGA